MQIKYIQTMMVMTYSHSRSNGFAKCIYVNANENSVKTFISNMKMKNPKRVIENPLLPFEG